MPIKKAQATDKQAILAEIRIQYPGASRNVPPRVWQDQNFTFKAPSDAWLRGLKPLAALDVWLQYRDVDGKNDVILKGETPEGKVSTKVGTIREG